MRLIAEVELEIFRQISKTCLVIHQVIRPFLLRRKKAEVEKYLPGKTQVILKCDLSSWQRLYYQQIIDSGRVGLDSGKILMVFLLLLVSHLKTCFELCLRFTNLACFMDTNICFEVIVR